MKVPGKYVISCCGKGQIKHNNRQHWGRVSIKSKMFLYGLFPSGV